MKCRVQVILCQKDLFFQESQHMTLYFSGVYVNRTKLFLKSGVQNPAWIFFLAKILKNTNTENLNKQIWPIKAVFWTMDFRTICVVVFCSGKIHIFWEGHKFFMKSPNFIWNYLVASKKVSRLRHIFVAFSEYINFRSQRICCQLLAYLMKWLSNPSDKE